MNRGVKYVKNKVNSTATFIYKHKYLIIFSTIIIFLYKYRKNISKYIQSFLYKSSQFQGNVNGKSIEPDEIQKENVWVKPVLHPIMFDKGSKCLTSNFDNLNKSVASNVAHAVFSSEDGTRFNTCNIFPLGNGMWVVPYHVLFLKYYRVRITYVNRLILAGPNFSTIYGKDSYVRIGDSDLALLFLNEGGSRKNMLPYFANNNKNRLLFKDLKCSLNYRDELGVITKMQGLGSTELFTPKVNGIEYEKDIAITYTLMNKNTFKGLCGSPLVVEGRHPFIAGFHIAGKCDQPYGVSQYISKDILDKYINILAERTTIVPYHFTETPDLCVPQQGINVSNVPNIVSPLRFLEGGNTSLNYFGTHDGQRRSFRSNVVKSLICDTVLEVFNIELKHGPPKNMNTYKPWGVQLGYYTHLKSLDVDYLKLAYDDLSNKIFKFLNSNKHLKKRIHPLDNDTILAGNDGVYGIDAINLSSSTGWPKNEKKSKYIKESNRVVPNISRPLDAEDWIFEEMNQCEEKLLQGIRVFFVHRCNLKDEPTKLTKDKVRVFSGTPLSGLLLVRKFFLPICKLIMDNPILFECAVGVNAHGTSWDTLTKAMLKYGDDRVIAGDYKQYDSTMSSQISSLAVKLFIDIAKWANYTEDSIKIMQGLLTELVNPLYEFNGDFILVNGSNPSGHSLTVFMNNLANSLYLRYAYYHIYPNTKIPFHEVVSAVCYGDDNKMSVKRGFDEFNHTSIQKVLANYDITYTMADKDAESKPFIKNEECSFLKRNSRYDEEIGFYMAPIEELTLHKILTTHLVSKELNLSQQSVEAVKNVSEESWFHGRNFYNDYRQKLLTVIEKQNLSVYFMKQPNILPTYDERLEVWRMKYLK